MGSLFFRRAIGLLTLIGASAGLISVLQAFFFEMNDLSSYLLYSVFALVYVLGISGGVMIIENRIIGLSFALAYWILQVPSLVTSLFVYKFSSALGFILTVSSAGKLNFDSSIGSQFIIGPGEDLDNIFGVNLLAIAIVHTVLSRYRAK